MSRKVPPKKIEQDKPVTPIKPAKPPRVSTKVQKAAMIKALEKTLGIVTTAADKVGIDRRTHTRWMRDDEKYRERVNEIEETALDFAESKLHKRMVNDSDAAIIFFLKTKGKKRGYIEKMEFDNTHKYKTTVIDTDGD